MLAMLVFLALFVRSYFGYSTSVDNGFLVSGGSDSYYHMRVIDHVVATGDQLLFDDMLNYPNGMMNPRPPLYDWSVAVFGMFLSVLTGVAMTDAVGMSLVFSTAVWGALTVIPVYMLGKAAFGRRAGILGAFVFAIMAGHIERSVLSNADHDAMVLFFVVFAFYFLLRSLQTVNGTNWVSSWKDRKAIPAGLRKYLSTNQTSLIYAAIGGVCVSAVGMIWTGFPYIMIIVLVYFLVQLLVDRFRNSDSMGVLFSITVFFGVAFLLMAPVYTMMDIWRTWFDIPLFLFAGGVVLGLMFVVTREYPWTLVLPAFTILGIATMAVLSVVSPTFFESIVSGQGYLVKSKLYDTISEAQAPLFSNLAMSFGMVTFWLSLIGVAWAAYKIPKNISPYFIFVVVWVGISIYMASSAARFVFNASPAFAVSAGWILALIIERLNFDEMVRNLRADHGGLIKTIRYSVKLKHVLGVVFIVLMILVPNTWYALDAGIPSNTKQDYDRQIYLTMPGFLRPGDYDVQNGTYWYFGAFTYGMSLPNEYWPSAWKWFSQQDSGTASALERPAFLSWWDYGFEAIQEGAHPAVADNFQNGYNFAGSFLMTQSEEGAIALFIVRCVEKDMTISGATQDALVSSMASHGVDVTRLKDILTNPANYVDEVRNNPQVYGYYDTDLSAANAKYAAARAMLADMGKDKLVEIYNDVREITGNDIGYVSVDSRLFPFSATSFNIFYAPALLSDQRVEEGTNIPYDYYNIFAIDYYGNTIPLDQITANDLIVSYEIEYTEAFYDTMLYKTFMGYGPSDVGETEQGIPGISGSLSNLPAMQGWNMSNFRLVYRTAYYNPYPSTQVADHSDAWRAVSYVEGVELLTKINSGEITGTVDLSSSSLYQGVTFLQYYDGAIIDGTVVSDSGSPMASLWVTVYDEYGIPHQVVQTDSDGHYSVIAPFGEVTLKYSYGDLDARLLVGTELHTETLYITYDQAMRVDADVDKDGKLDYLVDLDVEITAGVLQGSVYVDEDGNGKFSATTDRILEGATVVFENATLGYRAEAVSTSEGYEITGVSPMNGTMWVEYDGHVFGQTKVSVGVGTPVSTSFGVEPASISGDIILPDGSAANGVAITLLDRANGKSMEMVTGASGAYSFEGLLPGNYTILSPEGTVVESPDVQLDEGDSLERDLVLYQAMRVSGLVTYDATAVSNAMVGITGGHGTTWVRSDSRGRYSAVVPMGDVSLYATATVDGVETVYLSALAASTGQTLDIELSAGSVLVGTVQYNGSPASGTTVRLESRTSGAVVTAVVNASGAFRAVLPNGLYFMYAHDASRAYWGDIEVLGSMSQVFNLGASAKISGTAWYDADGNGAMVSAERLSDVSVTISDLDGRSVTVATGSDGAYSFILPVGRTYALVAEKFGYEDISKSYPAFDVSASNDLKMLAVERTVTGSIDQAIAGITLRFNAQSGTASSKTATTAADGSFSLSLAPGEYSVTVDQDVVPGDASVRYQTFESMDLTVDIGKDPSELDVRVVERVLVQGVISPAGTATMVFDGPELKNLTTGSSYSTYLMEGDYSLYTRVDNSSFRYAYLAQVTVSGPSSLNVSAATAAQVIIRAVMEGTTASQYDVVIESGGAYYNITSSGSGMTTVYLAAGTYTAYVDHHTVITLDMKQRFVRYTGNETFAVISTLKNVVISTERALDNATVQGNVTVAGAPTAAHLEFQPETDSAIAASVDTATGDYSVQLAPGNYTVYALSSDSSKAYLGRLVVPDPGTIDLDIGLTDALRLSGVTFANDLGARADVTISGDGEYRLTSDSSGAYEVYLPVGAYVLEATATIAELGMPVTYYGQAEVELSTTVSKGIAMERQTVRDVDVTWDSTQKAILSAGETAVYTIRVTNLGNTQDTFRLSYTGAGWTVELSQAEVTLGYGTGANSQTITVSITPSSSILVKHTPVTVRAVSSSDSTATDSVSLDATIDPFRAVAVQYSKALDTDGSEYLFEAKLLNNGNIDDKYTVTIGNLQQLEELGWQARLVDGNNRTAALSLSVSAAGSSTFQVSLVPLRENPSPTASVQVVAVSQADGSVQNALDLSPDFVGLDVDGGLSVTGEGVSTSPPQVGEDTFVLLGVALALMAVLLVLTIQKGVFSRRKR